MADNIELMRDAFNKASFELGILTKGQTDKMFEYFNKLLSNQPKPDDSELKICRTELEQKVHDAKEIYIGMEGFIPETAPEAYCLQTLKQMYEALSDKQDANDL